MVDTVRIQKNGAPMLEKEMDYQSLHIQPPTLVKIADDHQVRMHYI